MYMISNAVKSHILSLAVVVVVLLGLAGVASASDKYGGGNSSTSRSGDGNYSITTNSNSRYSSVDVRNNRTGEVSSFRDWNGDGDYRDRNEQMRSTPGRDGNGNNGFFGNTNRGNSGNGTTGSTRPRCVAGGSCGTTVSNNQCGIPVSVSGTYRCASTFAQRTCAAPASVPVATLQAPCVNINDFGTTNVRVVVNPTIVREGSSTVVTWDLGTSRNYHGNCTLTGVGVRGGTINETLTLPSRTGSVTIAEVRGPHQYTLACGTAATMSVSLRVIPSVYES